MMISVRSLMRLIPRIVVIVAVILFSIAGVATPAHAAPADAYWVGDGGNWSDAATHWALASGGAPGAGNAPDATTTVHFDANSFTLAGQSVTVDAVATCNGMDWTGVTNTPTLTGANQLTISGSLTLVAGMNWTHSTTVIFNSAGIGNNITMAGKDFGSATYFSGTGEWTLQDTFNNTSGSIRVTQAGNWMTGGQTVNAAGFSIQGVDAKTVTLGASTVNVGSSGWVVPGSAVTLPANTATINIAATGAFNGGGLTTYNVVSLNGSAHTVSGNNTFATLTLASGATQTITFTDDTVQTATTFNLSGSSGHVHTLQGSGVAGWSLSKAAGTVNADYISISRSTAGGGATFNANGVSINGGNNVGWNFPLTVSTQAASGVTMDKDGVVGGLFNGTLTDMGGEASDTTLFQYGLTTAYGSNTTTVARTSPASFTATIPAGLTPGQTYHYLVTANTTTTSANGTDQSFTLTLPTVTTSAATGVTYTDTTYATFNGNVTNMGVASDTYVRFLWGYAPSALTNSTAQQTIAGVSAVTATISGYTPDATIYYRTQSTTGGVTTLGAVTSFTIASSGSASSTGKLWGYILLNNVLTVLLATSVLVSVVVAIGKTNNWLIPTVIGLICFTIAKSLIDILF